MYSFKHKSNACMLQVQNQCLSVNIGLSFTYTFLGLFANSHKKLTRNKYVFQIVWSIWFFSIFDFDLSEKDPESINAKLLGRLSVWQNWQYNGYYDFRQCSCLQNPSFWLPSRNWCKQTLVKDKNTQVTFSLKITHPSVRK